MSITGITHSTNDIIYQQIIRKYKIYGDKMKWEMKDGTMIKIKNMETSHIKNCINMMNRKSINDTRRAWIEIFEDVIIKRRSNKIDRIKKRIKDGKTNN